MLRVVVWWVSCVQRYYRVLAVFVVVVMGMGTAVFDFDWRMFIIFVPAVRLQSPYQIVRQDGSKFW